MKVSLIIIMMLSMLTPLRTMRGRRKPACKDTLLFTSLACMTANTHAWGQSLGSGGSRRRRAKRCIVMAGGGGASRLSFSVVRESLSFACSLVFIFLSGSFSVPQKSLYILLVLLFLSLFSFPALFLCTSGISLFSLFSCFSLYLFSSLFVARN